MRPDRVALASTGWDVLATDTAYIVTSILKSNAVANAGSLQGRTIQTRELDWTVPPEQWTWAHPDHVATHAGVLLRSPGEQINLGPPFDLIFTSDTIFSVDLTPHLIRSLHHLCKTSGLSTDANGAMQYPAVYVALENRDPIATRQALDVAKDPWGFAVTQVPSSKVYGAMKRGGVDWDQDEWDGVEIWKFALE